MAGCVGQSSHFPFPRHFALLFSLVIFFQILKGPGVPLQRKRKFSFLPPFSSMSPFPPPPPSSPSLQSPLSQRSGGASPWPRKKKFKNFILRFALFDDFLLKHCRIEPHPSLVRYLLSGFAGSLARNFASWAGK